METVNLLNDKEKIFLAGCIKTMILADGKIDDAELKDLDKITKSFKFADFDKCLNVFEEQKHTTETFWQEAQTITKTETRDIVLAILYELSLQSGYANKPEKNLLVKLKDTWK